MSSFFQTVPTSDSDVARAAAVQNPWKLALGALAAVLLVGGSITVAVGLSIVGSFGDTVLGQSQTFDEGVAVAIVGGAAIFLSVIVGTALLILGAVDWRHRA